MNRNKSLVYEQINGKSHIYKSFMITIIYNLIRNLFHEFIMKLKNTKIYWVMNLIITEINFRNITVI